MSLNLLGKDGGESRYSGFQGSITAFKSHTRSKAKRRKDM